MGSTVSGMTEIGTDWRVVDGVATAWFDAPSLIEGAALAGRIVELSAEIVVDLRATGMRVRLDSDEHAEAVSAAARDLGLAANPAVLQQLSVVFESANPSVVRRFWQRVLDYAGGEGGGLAGPLRRDPAVRIRQAAESRPVGNRIPPPVVRPAAAGEQAGACGRTTPTASHSSSPTSPQTSRPLPANSGPLRIRSCRASLSSSSTPPTSPRSARSGSPHSDTPTTGEPGPATSTIRGG